MSEIPEWRETSLGQLVMSKEGKTASFKYSNTLLTTNKMENGSSENKFVFCSLISSNVSAFHANKAEYGSEESKSHPHHQQSSDTLYIRCMWKEPLATLCLC